MDCNANEIPAAKDGLISTHLEISRSLPCFTRNEYQPNREGSKRELLRMDDYPTAYPRSINSYPDLKSLQKFSEPGSSNDKVTSEDGIIGYGRKATSGRQNSRPKQSLTAPKFVNDSSDSDEDVIGPGRRSMSTRWRSTREELKSVPEDKFHYVNSDEESDLSIREPSISDRLPLGGGTHPQAKNQAIDVGLGTDHSDIKSTTSTSDDSSGDGTTSETTVDSRVAPSSCSISRRQDKNFRFDEVSDARWLLFKHMISEVEPESTEVHRLYPQSLWPDLPPPLQPSDEKIVLQELRLANEVNGTISDRDQFTSFTLRNFAVYRSMNHAFFPGQFESLHVVTTEHKDHHTDYHFYFDGIIAENGVEHYLQHMPIKTISIGSRFQPNIPTSRGHIWLQSVESSKYDVRYTLETPAPEYLRLWDISLWLADFSKYFLEYLHKSTDLSICLADFKSNFLEAVQSLHKDQQCFQAWHSQCDKAVDFRRHLVRFVEFLENQAHKTASPEEKQHQRGNRTSDIFKHRIWGEINPKTHQYSSRAKAIAKTKTIVTQNIADIFLAAIPAWAEASPSLLQVLDACEETASYRRKRVEKYKFPNKFEVPQDPHFEKTSSGRRVSMAALMLQNAPNSKAKTKLPPSKLVGKIVVIQGKSVGRNNVGRRSVYRQPLSRTIISPKVAEQKRTNGRKIEFRYAYIYGIDDFNEKLRVVWLLLPSDTTCGEHGFYPIGNELFFSDECNCHPVEPADICQIFDASVFTDRAEGSSKLFVRERYIFEDGMFVTAKRSEILCFCSQELRSSWKGVAKEDQVRDHGCTKLSSPPSRKMKNMSLFCGCGLLDWGIEASGSNETVLAIDCNPYAMQTYATNQQNSSCRNITASVDDHLAALLLGREKILPIDCITAGTPCKAFSLLNLKPENRAGLKNSSLVASTMSYVDIFLPIYSLVENVPNMDGTASPNMCEQTVCTLVALGYQVQKWLPLAAEQGDAQSRERLCIVATAPGFTIPEVPLPIHGNGAGLEKEVTASQALEGLETIDNDVLVNLKNPDHIPIVRLRCNFKNRVNLRSVVRKIPTLPLKMNLAKTYLSEPCPFNSVELRWVESLAPESRTKQSRTLQRTDPSAPFHTIVARFDMMDGRSCPKIHFDENRSLSLEEYKRAMGLFSGPLLEKVFVGPLLEQVTQLGNAVPFHMGRALGTSMGRAWLTSVSGPGAGVKTIEPKNLVLDLTKPSDLSKKRKEADDDDDIVFLRAGPVQKKRKE